jgi:hypothetical protein
MRNERDDEAVKKFTSHGRIMARRTDSWGSVLAEAAANRALAIGSARARGGTDRGFGAARVARAMDAVVPRMSDTTHRDISAVGARRRRR